MIAPLRVFHGSENNLIGAAGFSPTPHGGQSDEPFWLFASVSYRAASQYGKVFSTTLCLAEPLPQISARDWMYGEPVPEGSFVIRACADLPDFQEDTYVLDGRERWVSELFFARVN